MPRFLWNSEAGRTKLLVAARKSNLSCPAAESAETWAAAVQGSNSKIAVVCVNCERNAFVFVRNVVRGHGIQCRCNGLAGRTDASRLRDIAKRLGIEFVDLLEERSYTAREKLEARCTGCRHRGTVIVNALTTKGGRKMACFCNRGVKYETESARLHLLDIVCSNRMFGTTSLIGKSGLTDRSIVLSRTLQA